MRYQFSRKIGQPAGKSIISHFDGRGVVDIFLSSQSFLKYIAARLTACCPPAHIQKSGSCIECAVRRGYKETMNIVSRIEDGVTHLQVAGRIDASTSSNIDNAADAAFGDGQKNIIFDLREVSY